MCKTVCNLAVLLLESLLFAAVISEMPALWFIIEPHPLLDYTQKVLHFLLPLQLLVFAVCFHNNKCMFYCQLFYKGSILNC